MVFLLLYVWLHRQIAVILGLACNAYLFVVFSKEFTIFDIYAYFALVDAHRHRWFHKLFDFKTLIEEPSNQR